MIASVGMAVCKRAATLTALHVIAENSMTCIMSVVQSVRSAVMPQSAARRPTTTSTSVDSDIHIGRQRHPHRPMRMDRGKQKSPRESRREASNKQLFFVPAKAGLFERPKAAFFTVTTDGVMPCMTVGMAETTRRETHFPTGGTTSHTKAKPTVTATAFCVYVIPL